MLLKMIFTFQGDNIALGTAVYWLLTAMFNITVNLLGGAMVNTAVRSLFQKLHLFLSSLGALIINQHDSTIDPKISKIYCLGI